MLTPIITSLVQQMNDHLRLIYKLSESIVYLSPPTKETSGAFPSNRISVSVVNVEKENIGGSQYVSHTMSGSHSRRSGSGLQISISVLIAAVFLEKQYKESIQLLSGALSFLQNNTAFHIQGVDSVMSLEIINLSFNELSNLWGVCGGTYYPSVVCKIRVLSVGDSGVVDFATIVGQPDMSSKIKK